MVVYLELDMFDRSRALTMAATCAAAWTVIGLVCVAGVNVSVLSGAKDASPGSFATHVFTIQNPDASGASFSVTVAAPQGWQVLGFPDEIALGPGEERIVFLTVTLADDAEAGDYAVDLTASALNDPRNASTASAWTLVTPVTELSLHAPDGQAILPGGTVEYVFTISNRGNAQDSYVVEALSSRGLDVSISDPIVPLAPREYATVSVRVRIAVDAEPGQDTLTVRAASTLYAGVEAQAAVVTRLLPPGPSSIGRGLMEILPARIRLSMDKDVLEGLFDSRLTFSVSGRVLDGFFSLFVNADHPLGTDPVELSSYSFLYRREPIVYSLGTVSKRLTELVSMSCRGGSVEADLTTLHLAFIGGGLDDEARAAGRLTLGPEVANLGLVYSDVRDASSRAAILGATAEARPLEDWWIRSEVALGTDAGLTSSALYLNTTIDTASYFLDANAFSVGTYFPGSRADSAGIDLSQRLRLSNLSLALSLGHDWDNVVGDPLVTTIVRDALGFNLSTTPLQGGPTLSSTVEFSWDRSIDPATRSDVKLLLYLEMTETQGVFPYAFSARTLDQIDRIHDTHLRTMTFSEGAGLSVDSFYVFLEVTHEKRIDVNSDLILSGGTDVSLVFRPRGTLHEASITLENTGDDFDLGASMLVRLLDTVDVRFDGSIGWDRADASEVAFGWGIALNASLDIPLPFLVTKGQIAGRVFIDRDGDRIFGLGDTPVYGAIVAADGIEVSTDSAGIYRLPPMYRGTMALSVRNLPADAAAVDPMDVVMYTGRIQTVDFALKPVAVVSGTIFQDEDRDGRRGADEIEGFQSIRIVVTGENKSSYDATTDAAGAFMVRDIGEGTYVLEIDRSTLPDRFEFTTPDRIQLDVASGGIAAIEIGGVIRPRDVLMTFQPPTADFVWSPERPSPGEAVRFDGSASLDLDGELLFYAWDLDGDGAIDATEPRAAYTFPAPGAHPVSLTVTDDTGNSDTLTATITIEGADSSQERAAQPPIARIDTSPPSPEPGDTIRFDGTGSFDPDGEIAAYAWDLDADGIVDAIEPVVERTMADAGRVVASLTVIDQHGLTGTATAEIVIAAPTRGVDAGQTSAGNDDGPGKPPIADFAYTPTAPHTDEPVAFDASSSTDPDGSIVLYAWDFDDDGTVDATGTGAIRSFSSDGVYEVTLAVTDDDGHVGTVTLKVAVSEARNSTGGQPPIADFAYAPQPVRVGALTTFNGTESGDPDGLITGFFWDFDADGTVDSTDPIAGISFGDAGTFEVTLTVADAEGNSDTLTLPVEVVPAGSPAPSAAFQPPIADFSYTPGSPTAGEPVSFDASPSVDFDGSISSYEWDFDADGSIDATAEQADHTFDIAGPATVSLTVTDSDGNTDTVAMNLTVAPSASDGGDEAGLPPRAQFTYSPTSPIAGEPVEFNGLYSEGAADEISSYAWDYDGDGVTDSAAPIVVHVFAVPGSHVVRLTVTDAAGRSATRVETVSVG